MDILAQLFKRNK